ncbi:MAG: hypothetical protein IPH06_07615 [Alphaproteobacteria bacterium]|nr:hypothetical protein [Alphaproteobacteria bacterium]QQS57875.1 MAG: hypothetical protein IPN28_03375 [Alphaproteobacteria bacterium]
MIQKSILKLILLILILPICSCGYLPQSDSKAQKAQWDKKYDGYRFSPFASQDEDREAFRRMFPQGTSRAYVEHILIDKAGARIGRDGSNDDRDRLYFLVSYVEPRTLFRGEKGSWRHLFYYDMAGKVLNIKPFGERDLYDTPLTCSLSQHPLSGC